MNFPSRLSWHDETALAETIQPGNFVLIVDRHYEWGLYRSISRFDKDDYSFDIDEDWHWAPDTERPHAEQSPYGGLDALLVRANGIRAVYQDEQQAIRAGQEMTELMAIFEEETKEARLKLELALMIIMAQATA